MSHDWASYNHHLKSARWKIFRETWFLRHGKFCRACGTMYGPIQLHHWNGYGMLGHETDADVIALCEKDHKKLEKIIKLHGRSNRRFLTELFIKRKGRM